MARQPTQDLQGYNQVASPSTSPLDTYTGTVAAPRQSSANELADALGTLSKTGQQSIAQAKAEKDRQDKDRLAAYLTRHQSELESGYVDAVKAGEAYADTSEVVVTTAVTDFHRNRAYNETKALLLNLDDDKKMDVVGLEAYFDTLIQDSAEKTDGMDFVQSGTVQGVRNAINEARGTFSAFRNTKTKEMVKSNTEAEVFSIVSKYGVGSDSVKLMNALNEKQLATSPFSKREDKQHIVDALIQYNKTNPDSNAISLIQKIPFLGGKETELKLEKAAPVISALGLQKLKDDAQRDKLNRQRTLDESQLKLNEMSLNNDKDGIRKVMAKATELTGKDAPLGVDLFKMAEIALASADVDEDLSQEFAATFESGLVVKAIKGELSRKDALAEIASSSDMREEEKEAIRGNLDNIMAGNNLIAASKHSTEFNNRVGDEAKAIDQSILNLGGEIEGRSLESRVRDLWDDTVYDLIQNYVKDTNTIPEGTALRKIYDEAESIAERRMEKLRGITPPPPQSEPLPPLEKGAIIELPDGTKGKYLGGDINDDSNFEIITEEEEDAGISIIEEIAETFTK